MRGLTLCRKEYFSRTSNIECKIHINTQILNRSSCFSYFKKISAFNLLRFLKFFFLKFINEMIMLYYDIRIVRAVDK